MLFSRIMQATLVAIALFSVAAPLAPALAETNKVQKSLRPYKADQLIGMKVEDRDGQELGKVRDFAVDRQHGRLEYVIVATGGHLGVGTRLKAVPPRIMAAGTAKRNTVALQLTREQWNRAPICKPAEIPSLNQSRPAGLLQKFYSDAAPDIQIASRESPGVEAAGSSPAETGQREGRHPANTPLILASDFIGKRVVNRQHEKVGEILDLLVEFSGEKPVFALMATSRLFKAREHQYAVPLRSLMPTDEAGEWMIDANRELLERAGPFDSRAWNLDTLIYRYQDSGHVDRDTTYVQPRVSVFKQSVVDR
jgi:sporulation protein YlmC with PRC-barrel domain